MTNVNGTLFFQADDGTDGAQLWKSDGTSAGTVMVSLINPSGDANLINLTDVNGELFFQADDGTDGAELWKSDGTSVGTVMVDDINPGSYSSYPKYLTNVNGELFFQADDGTDGAELWKSDGTAAATVMVKDINPNSNSYGVPYGSDPTDLTNVNGTLFFQANDGTDGVELWKSDGTSAGTVLVADIFPGTDAVSGLPNSSNPTDLTPSAAPCFFKPTTGPTASNSGRATAPAPEP